MTAPTIEGLPDVGTITPDVDVIVQIPLGAWRMATSWIAGAKPPAGTSDPMDQINIRFDNHPHHYGDTWGPDPIVDQAVTVAVTDRYRLAWSTIATLGNPDPGNQLRYLTDLQPGSVSVDASDALRAMRGWPTVATKEMRVHAVELIWDASASDLTIILFNAETGQRMATSILPLFDGLHEFPKAMPDVAALPDPAGLFAINPSHVKALTAAAVTAGHSTVHVRANDKRVIVLRTEPVDLDEAVTVYSTALVTPVRVQPKEEQP